MARRLLPTLLLTLAGVVGLLPAATAAPVPATTVAPAEDAYPSAEEIARAKAQADAKAAATSTVEARLAAARSALTEAGRTAEQAVEAHNGAQVRLERARTAAAAAERRSAEARTAHAAAAERAAQLAAETYRQGASAELSAIDALLGARGPRAATEQAAAVGMAGSRTRQILDEATATAAEADRAAEAARTAETEAARAADAVRTTREQAEARLAAIQEQAADTARRGEQLLTELATARNTTLDLERRRQEALEAIAARQAEEEARAAALAAAAAAAAVPTGPTPPSRPAADNAWSAGGAQAAVAFARSLIGLPYVWGGEGPTGYDCSGLTMMAWRAGGRRLTHFAADQYAESTPVTYRQLRPGDLVFWTRTGRPEDIYHVGIYLGGDQMIEAPRPGTEIKQASLWIMGIPDFYARP
ncbi:C40 family peptidase [Kitasatospora sp. NPDC088346]|uniref:C40 family peptidase n=1 Tax=Kitasatospora sp. NPDC088346 TaxID=3364073 RepID=UPI003830D9DB